MLPKSRNFFICLAQSRAVLRKIENILLNNFFWIFFHKHSLLLIRISLPLNNQEQILGLSFIMKYLIKSVLSIFFVPFFILSSKAVSSVHLIRCNWFVKMSSFGQSSGQMLRIEIWTPSMHTETIPL